MLKFILMFSVVGSVAAAEVCDRSKFNLAESIKATVQL